MAAPFVLLLGVFLVISGDWQHFPPRGRMSAAWWIPAILCVATYAFLLFNVVEYRKGRWRWNGAGLITAVCLLLLWGALALPYEKRMRAEQRYKLHLRGE